MEFNLYVKTEKGLYGYKTIAGPDLDAALLDAGMDVGYTKTSPQGGELDYDVPGVVSLIESDDEYEPEFTAGIVGMEWETV